MKRFPKKLIKGALKAIGWSLVGAFVAGVVAFVLTLENRPDLHIWHEVKLDAEFTRKSDTRTFAEYLELEDRLLAQLREQVYDQIEPEGGIINRYYRGSLADPNRWSTNWNRSFELTASKPAAGVLLLHGMSDSPYSLRHIGRRLHAGGAYVVALRLPGHGTAPSELVRIKWEDLAAAVRIAVRHLKEKIGDKPLFIIGYSNGGALAVHYALDAIKDSSLPKPNGIVLLSPSIGVSRLAALAKWQGRLGRLAGLEKLAWTDIGPEYDPFKYVSFAVNAGDQVYRLTEEIQSSINKLTAESKIDQFPPVLAFQSVADATVSPPALVANLFNRLRPNGHELVLFDVNRFAKVRQLFKSDPKDHIRAVLNVKDSPFALTLLTNRNDSTLDIMLRHKEPGNGPLTETPTDMKWPHELYSLSHISLPFPPGDPLYGGGDSDSETHLRLGKIELRGERGVLQVSAASMLRLRWNPFYPYLERRVVEFILPQTQPVE